MTAPIITKRLSLRPLHPADAPAFVAMLGDLEVSKWMAQIPHPYGAEDFAAFAARTEALWPDMMVIDLAGSAIGSVYTGTGLGAYLERAHWAKGYGAEACSASIDHVFDRTDRASFKTGYFVGNMASERLLKRLGFAELGHSMQMCLARQQALPHVDMELTRAAWEARP